MREIAHLAQAVIEKRLPFLEFSWGLSEEELDDSLIAELVDILEHEPKFGSLFGVSEEKHRKYMARAHNIIASIIRGDS